MHSSNLEEQVECAQAAEASMMAFEQMREVAASLYLDEVGSSWKPMTASRPSHSANLTSAVIDARDFLRARSERRHKAHMPEGTPVVFAGGRSSFQTVDEAKAFADLVWSTLEKVRGNVPDMILVHGGDGKGADRLVASWAEAPAEEFLSELEKAAQCRTSSRSLRKGSRSLQHVGTSKIVSPVGNLYFKTGRVFVHL